ncbi:MAG: hypothetical protein KJ955_07950 [Nanoarchaeota archaeon]|nr:hypothetical protein [Nanoarchaeota archaeon]
MEYTKNELKYFAVIILTLGLAFAFNDKSQEFVLANWLLNFVKMLVFVTISVFVHDFAHDLMAKKYGFISEYRIWGIKRFFLRERFPKKVHIFGRDITIHSFPIGIVLCLLVMLLSNGRLFFTAVSSYGLVIKKEHRFGHKIIEVTDFEEAKIALAGPMANILLAIFFKLISPSGMFAELVLINSIMPVFDMLPLLGLDGLKVMIGSTPLYAFSFVFILGTAILLYFLGALPALIMALAMSGVFFLVYLWRTLTK